MVSAPLATLVLSIAPLWTLLRAQTPPAPTVRLTLAQAIAIALERSPDVKLAQAAVDSARGESRVARSWPALSLASIPNTPFQYGATLPLDLTPARIYRTRVGSLGVAAADADRRDANRTISVNVARAFYDVLLADDRRAIADQRRDAVRRVLASDSARVKAGDLAPHNLARSVVELARADASVARAQADAETARLTLQTLLAVPLADTIVEADGSLAYRRIDIPDDSLAAAALRDRPDVAAADRRVEQSVALDRAARTSLIPVPQLSYVRQFGGPFESGHYYAFGVGVELPSPGAYLGAKDRATAGLDAARWHARAVTSQVERDVRAALVELRIQQGLVERYEGGVLAKVAESVAAAQYAYDRGAASLLDVIDAIRAQQDARDDYSLALHDYWVSVYALNAAAGSPVVRP
jgi:cobalt-zinc-cadmium efflux system outer membrane protein